MGYNIEKNKGCEKNMRKLLPLIVLLLTVTMLLNACTPSSQDPTDDTTESTTESTTDTETSEEPVTINNIWYSRDEQTVLDLTDLSNVTYYSLKIGFYEYEEKINPSCTYTDSVLTLTFENESTLVWSFDEKSGMLVSFNGNETASYTVMESLPTQYEQIFFPDYSKMDCETLISLGAHTGLKLPTDDDLETAVSLFSEIYGAGLRNQPVITGRTAQMKDYVNIDYKGFLDGVAFVGGEAEDVDLLIASDSGYIPGFAEGVAGHEIGSTFDIEVTFPDNYQNTEMAGKTVIFTMTLNAIYDLRGSFLWSQVIENSKVENFPEETYAFFLQYYREYYHMYAYYYEMEYEDFLSQYAGITDADLIELAKINALNYITVYALLSKYDIAITDEAYQSELNFFIQDMMEAYGTTYEEAKNYVLENEANNLHSMVARSTVINWLISQNAN